MSSMDKKSQLNGDEITPAMLEARVMEYLTADDILETTMAAAKILDPALQNCEERTAHK